MSEWTVVTVVIALIGLVAAVLKPVISLNTTITRLTEIVNALGKDIEELTTRNTDSHRRLWEKSDEHEERLNDHETRLKMIEH